MLWRNLGMTAGRVAPANALRRSDPAFLKEP